MPHDLSTDRPSLEQIFKVVEQKRDRIIALMQGLIRIPTVVPPGDNYEALVNFLEPLFKKIGFTTDRIVVPEEYIKSIPYPLKGPRINLVATREHGRKETVTIYAHMDVVPIEEPWTKDPFEGIVEGDKLYGRGACDMKSGIAGMLIALEVMDELRLEPHYNIVCTLCTDEEIGVYPGIYHLAKEGYVKGHVINTEGGTQDPIIIAGVAGMVDVIIRTKGRSAHSGISFVGINAVEEMLPFIDELRQLKVEIEKRESSIPILPALREVGAPSDQMTSLFNLNIIRGGTKSNIVPSECELVINRRYISEEKYDDIIAEIQAAIDRGMTKSKALDVEVTFIHAYYPFKTDTESKYIQKMNKALKAVHGYQESDLIYGGASISTDMGFVAKALNTDKFVGVGGLTVDNLSAHQPDEYVRISDLINLIKQLIHYLCL
ncbi:MAG: M20 family metallopeptidase [Promethearchaeota archaeon]